MTEKSIPSSWNEVVSVVAQLRNPEGGCPWDLEQTHESLRTYLREETLETDEVLSLWGTDQFSDDNLCEELGDVLLQVLLHAQLASERGAFTVDDVVQGLIDKLIRRHPHVFGESDARTIEEVVEQWDKIKAEEKKEK